MKFMGKGPKILPLLGWPDGPLWVRWLWADGMVKSTYRSALVALVPFASSWVHLPRRTHMICCFLTICFEFMWQLSSGENK